MDINLIEYFGVALKEHDTLSNEKVNELKKIAAKTGYIIHPDCYNSSILRWLKTHDVNMNSTFYKTWEDVCKRDRYQLFIEQTISYIINYGMGGNFNMNDGDYSMVPDIRKYKCILPISEVDLFVKCRDILYSGIALKDHVSSAFCKYIAKYYNDYFKLGLISIDAIKNKEAQVKICDLLHIVPDGPFNLIRYMVYKSTGNAMIIKNNLSINSIIRGNDFDMSKLSQRNLESLASIFYRYKPIFLAFKKQCKKNISVVNKIRRLAKIHHRPLITGIWEDIVNKPMSIEALKKNLEENAPSNFKIITIIQAIRENQLVFGAVSRQKMYIIRNGSIWIDKLGTPDVISTKYEWWDILEKVLYNLLVKRLKEKACTVKFPQDLNLTCPTSEKTFIGNIPFGSYYNITDHNMFGIYWRNEWGTRDFDLSFIYYNGAKIGWNSQYYDDNRSILYSGDMTNANPEASEVIYLEKGCPNGIIKVNRYNGRENSKYIFSVAQSEVTHLPKNYMIDPNTIKFQVEVESGVKMEQMIGFVNNKRLYMCTFDTANARVSGVNGRDELAGIINRKMHSFVDLKRLLIDAGFKIRQRGTKDNPIDLDLTDLKKDTLIKLFS